MFGKLLQTIFLPKQTRDKLAAQPKSSRVPRGPGGQPQVAAGRDQLLNEALTVYRSKMATYQSLDEDRSKMATYQSLDEETRRQIEEDAAKAFGEAMVTRKT
jgi:hypothetical protein